MRLASLLLLMLTPLLAADVTGTWIFDVELSVGSGSPTFVLKQEGDKLTGTYSGSLGESPVTGKVEGDKIELSFEINTEGQKLKAVYTGTIKSDTEMAGKADYGGVGEGTWTAKKRKS
jgi:hypothetical protein